MPTAIVRPPPPGADCSRWSVDGSCSRDTTFFVRQNILFNPFPQRHSYTLEPPSGSPNTSSSSSMLAGLAKAAKAPGGRFKSSFSPYARDVCEKHKRLPRVLLPRLEHARPPLPSQRATGSSTCSTGNIRPGQHTASHATLRKGTVLGKSASLSALATQPKDPMEEELVARLGKIRGLFEQPLAAKKTGKLSTYFEERAKPKEPKLMWPPLEHRLAMPMQCDGQPVPPPPPRRRDPYIPVVPQRVLDRWAQTKLERQECEEWRRREKEFLKPVPPPKPRPKGRATSSDAKQAGTEPRGRATDRGQARAAGEAGGASKSRETGDSPRSSGSSRSARSPCSRSSSSRAGGRGRGHSPRGSDGGVSRSPPSPGSPASLGSRAAQPTAVVRGQAGEEEGAGSDRFDPDFLEGDATRRNNLGASATSFGRPQTGSSYGTGAFESSAADGFGFTGGKNRYGDGFEKSAASNFYGGASPAAATSNSRRSSGDDGPDCDESGSDRDDSSARSGESSRSVSDYDDEKD